MNGHKDVSAVRIEYNVNAAPLDTLANKGEHSFELDAAKPHLVALQSALESARGHMNTVLTAWKAEIGESEKPKEAAAQKAHEAAKKADLEDDSDEGI